MAIVTSVGLPAQLPRLEPHKHTPTHLCSGLLSHRDNAGGSRERWARWKSAQHQKQHETYRSQVRAACLQGAKGRCQGFWGYLLYEVWGMAEWPEPTGLSSWESAQPPLGKAPHHDQPGDPSHSSVHSICGLRLIENLFLFQTQCKKSHSAEDCCFINWPTSVFL